MVNMSAAMAGRFVEVATELTEQIRSIGSNPLKNSLFGISLGTTTELPEDPIVRDGKEQPA